MKTKLYLVTVLTVFNASTLLAQTTFQRTYAATDTTTSSIANAVRQCSDGGYVFTGCSNIAGGLTGDIFLAKTNASGDTLWSKSYVTPGGDIGYDVNQTTDGGYIITGAVSNNASSPADILLLKTDSGGNELWNKVYATSRYDQGTSVQQTNDGGYIITGIARDTLSTFGDLFLIKTDATGDTLWSKTFGGAARDEGNSVVQTTDGGYVVIGTTKSFSGNNTSDIYFLKTSASGSLIWERTLGTQATEYGFAVRQTNDGGFIIAGSTDSTFNSSLDVYLIKTDDFGNVQWYRNHGDTLRSEYVNSIEQTIDGGFIIAGSSWQNAINPMIFLLKTDAFGFHLWTETFTGAMHAYSSSLQLANDGGYILGGNSSGSGNTKMYLIKTDNTGNSGCNQATTAISTGSTEVTSTIVSSSIPAINIVISSLFFSVLGGSNLDTWCLSVGTIEHNHQTVINFFPNPATSQILISIDGYIGNMQLQVVNVHGQQVINQKLQLKGEVEYSMNITSLNPGVYRVILYNDAGVSIGKFVKE